MTVSFIVQWGNRDECVAYAIIKCLENSANTELESVTIVFI